MSIPYPNGFTCEAIADRLEHAYLGMSCPRCGDPAGIDIYGRAWLRVRAEGTDPGSVAEQCYDYDPDSTAMCTSCGFTGQVRDFEQ